MEPEVSLPHSQQPATCQSLPIPYFILGISWLGHKARPGHCNMQHSRFSSDWSFVCFLQSFLQYFISEWLTATTFRAGTPFMSLPYVAKCPWEGLRNITALVWVGYRLWRWGIKLPCGVYYCKFHDLFPSWGEHSVNHGWLCSGEDVGSSMNFIRHLLLV